MSTGQLVTTPDGASWHFEAGAECLDFAYALGTLPGARSAAPVETATSLGSWLAERVPRLAADDATDRDLLDARTLARAIARLAEARQAGASPESDDIDVINLVAATPDLPPRLAGGGRQAGATRIRIGQALSWLARDAIDVFSGDPAALRRCGAADCDLVFRDESRTQSRRWCSMQRCGNRAKVRAHRERARAAR
ncbi:CGNR zinc finger domain-containing protein [uncultured Schumannella sp.]|uniref:CGNR zinc finger domain-containing protein n=1 Tax=uncultured Schumannella sp. TaxID=1195956 RepID=UPI0025DE34F2|nr:CGNR zinc finger domain-containing protein [uncultured Schumannella sp.]